MPFLIMDFCKNFYYESRKKYISAQKNKRLNIISDNFKLQKMLQSYSQKN